MKERLRHFFSTHLLYTLVIVAGVLLLCFAGEQSVVNFIKRSRELRHVTEQRDLYRRNIEQCEIEMRNLQNTDSLERFARETYLMHLPNEDLYIVRE